MPVLKAPPRCARCRQPQVRAFAFDETASQCETWVCVNALCEPNASQAVDTSLLLSPLAPLLAQALGQLAAYRTRSYRGTPHLPTCPRGHWVNDHPAPDGAPCSKRCAAVGRLLGEAASYGVQPVAPKR